MIGAPIVLSARRLLAAGAFAALVAGGAWLTGPTPPAAASPGCGPTYEDDLYDADGDGIGCHRELNIVGTDPDRYDTDGDGVGDGDELRYGTDPLAVDFAPGQAPPPGAQNLPGYDFDGDGLGAYDEQTYGTDVTLYDTDGDGLGDGAEIAYPTNPIALDTDGDGYGDGFEVSHNMDPLFFDTVGP